jgi:hypothetical protein
MEKDISGSYAVSLDHDVLEIKVSVSINLFSPRCFSIFNFHPTLAMIVQKKNHRKRVPQERKRRGLFELAMIIFLDANPYLF